MLAYVHFYSVGIRDTVKPVRLWAALLNPKYIHTTLSLNRVVLFDQPYKALAGWYDAPSHVQTRPPTSTIPIPLTASIEDVERASALVEGWRTNMVGSAAHVLVGWPHFPRNCTTSVCTILTALGYPVCARTPDELWNQLNARRTEQAHASGV